MHPDTADRFFLVIVRRCASAIGYGRMMQIVSHEWWRHDPNGALTVGTCYALLSPVDRETHEAMARGDDVFKKNPE